MNDKKSKVLYDCISEKARQLIYDIKIRHLLQIPFDADDTEIINEYIQELGVLADIEEELFGLNQIKERAEGAKITLIPADKDEHQFDIITN